MTINRKVVRTPHSNMGSLQRTLTLIGFLVLASLNPWVCSLSEEDRVQAYHDRGYQWPLQSVVPDTPGWKKLMTERLQQVQEIPDDTDRFEAYAQTLCAAVVQRNFTEHGFGVARAPEDLMEALREGIRQGLEDGPELEHEIKAIEGERPWFIKRPDLTQRVLEELQQYPEAWAGMELTPVVAYGFRLYRNQSRLHVHVDKTNTHVISFILHIASSKDADPWPILIEDYEGNTHEVVLTSGDILFYESSKVFHGRPRTFNGSWYSSVFVHYYPKYGYQEAFSWNEKIFAIPPHWQEKPTTKKEVAIQMHGTTFEEPDCPNRWCRTETSIQWSGPGEEGVWIAPNGERYPFDPTKKVCMDKDEECGRYLELNAGECDKNPNYMLQFCTKSCGKCTSDDHEEL